MPLLVLVRARYQPMHHIHLHQSAARLPNQEDRANEE
jgi:hypothetical protein